MSFRGTLKPFQVEAFDKMIERRQVLVAYEMGLGKTVLTIAVIEHLLDEGAVAGGLVVVPSSLKFQWQKEIEKFTTDATVVVIDGTKGQRESQYEEVMAGGVEYVVMNYEQVVVDWNLMRWLPRDFVVLDEATAIKNPAAKRTQKVKRLRSPIRYGLSGQPIENRPEEIFSIMQYIDKEVLGDPEIFDRTFIKRNSYGGVKYYKNLPTLHRRLTEVMVRKTRQDPDVKPYMPDVVEEVYPVKFDAEGARLYRYIANELLLDLGEVRSSGFDLEAHYFGGEQGTEEQGRIMSKLTCLRMLCDHPELLRRSASMYDGTLDGYESMKGGSMFASELAAEGRLDKLASTPKLRETVALIEELLEANPRNQIVLFSFFKETLRILRDATSHLTKSVIFDGSMTAKEKDAAKTRFQTDPEVRLFLSSDAGGYGVDLPNANYLISYDLPWSAGKLDQRNARIIRLSSEFKEVTLISMVMQGSIEERQYDMLTQKRAIASAIVDGKGIDKRGRLDMGLKTLTEFLATTAV